MFPLDYCDIQRTMGNSFASPHAGPEPDPDFDAFQQIVRPIFNENFEPGAYERLEDALYNFMNVLDLQIGIYRIYENTPPPFTVIVMKILQAMKRFEFKTPHNANREHRTNPLQPFLTSRDEDIVLGFGHHFLYYIFMNHLALHFYRRGIRIDLSAVEIPTHEDIRLAQVIHTCIMKPALILDGQPEWFANQKHILRLHPLNELVSWMLIDMLRESSDEEDVEIFEDYFKHRETVLANTMGRRTYLGDGEFYDTDDPLKVDEASRTINGVRFTDAEAFKSKKEEIEALSGPGSEPSTERDPQRYHISEPKKEFEKTDIQGSEKAPLAKGFLNIYHEQSRYILPVYLILVKSKKLDHRVLYKFIFRTPALFLFKIKNQKVSRAFRFTPLSKQLEGKLAYKEEKKEIKVKVVSYVQKLEKETLYQLLNEKHTKFDESVVVGNTQLKYDDFVKMYIK